MLLFVVVGGSVWFDVRRAQLNEICRLVVWWQQILLSSFSVSSMDYIPLVSDLARTPPSLRLLIRLLLPPRPPRLLSAPAPANEASVRRLLVVTASLEMLFFLFLLCFDAWASVSALGGALDLAGVTGLVNLESTPLCPCDKPLLGTT